VHIVASLADALDASFALFESRRVPRKVHVYLGAQPLQVQPLASSVCRADEPDLAVLDAALDQIAGRSAPILSTLDERGGAAGVQGHRFIRKLPA
jgi:hypothetical protein